MVQSTNLKGWARRHAHRARAQILNSAQNTFLCKVHKVLATSQRRTPSRLFLIHRQRPGPHIKARPQAPHPPRSQMDPPVVANANVRARPALAPLSNTTIRATTTAGRTTTAKKHVRGHLGGSPQPSRYAPSPCYGPTLLLTPPPSAATPHVDHHGLLARRPIKACRLRPLCALAH